MTCTACESQLNKAFKLPSVSRCLHTLHVLTVENCFEMYFLMFPLPPGPVRLKKEVRLQLRAKNLLPLQVVAISLPTRFTSMANPSQCHCLLSHRRSALKSLTFTTNPCLPAKGFVHNAFVANILDQPL